ncbi:MAG TPA: hypothetical protein VF092_00770, partial [Longimicrobium sp.]
GAAPNPRPHHAPAPTKDLAEAAKMPARRTDLDAGRVDPSGAASIGGDESYTSCRNLIVHSDRLSFRAAPLL